MFIVYFFHLIGFKLRVVRRREKLRHRQKNSLELFLLQNTAKMLRYFKLAVESQDCYIYPSFFYKQRGGFKLYVN